MALALLRIKSYTLEQELLRCLEEEELQKLKEFDLNVKYGPCIGEMHLFEFCLM